MHGRGRIGCRYGRKDRGGARAISPLGARKPDHRSRPGWIDGIEKAGGLFLMTALMVDTWRVAESDARRHGQPDYVAAAQKPLLRFTTAGSVDDGKSTLIGRLLYDVHSVHEDHMESVRKNGLN